MRVAPFDIQSRLADGVLRLSVFGELDLASAPVLARRLEGLRAAGSPPIEVDLGDVTFIDASGLRALLEAHAVLNATGAPGLCLVDASPPVRRLFDLTGTSDRLAGPIEPLPPRS